METTLSLHDNQQILLALESVIERTGAFLKRQGLDRRGSISPANRAVFLGWPVERLRRVTVTASKILKVHLEAEKEPEFDIDDSSRLLKIALRELGLSIDPTFYPQIDRTDVIEVYNSEHFQIFRSFNFFRLCNYNLDDVLSHEWFELYERAESVTKEIMDVGMEHFSSPRTVTKIEMQPHLMRERFSEVRASFITKFKYFANIYSGPDQKHGYVIVTNGRPYNPESANVEFLGRNQKMSAKPFGEPV